MIYIYKITYIIPCLMFQSYSFLTSGGSKDIPSGLLAAAKMNSRSRFFLASTENYFAGHRVEIVMIDSGCNTILLPIKAGELESFKTKFSPDKFSWQLGTSKGVSHRSISLRISPNNGVVPLELCKDLINNAGPSIVLASDAKSRSFLRFHLSTEDMERLLLPDMTPMFTENATTILSDYLKDNKTVIQRKKYVLLGQALLQKFACIQLYGLMGVFNPAAYEPYNGWKDMERLRLYVEANMSLLPQRFNDLEDEDHIDDAVDDEEYCPTLDIECIDESGGEFYD